MQHLSPHTCVLARLTSPSQGKTWLAWDGMAWVGIPLPQMLSLRIYNIPTLSTISRLRLLGANSVYRLQTATPPPPNTHLQFLVGRFPAINVVIPRVGRRVMFWHHGL